MRKSPADPTTAENLEAKFDRGEDVLDYFDVRTARLIRAQESTASSKNQKATSSRTAEPTTQQKAITRYRAGRYRGRKKR